jgi:hypothetical protein
VGLALELAPLLAAGDEVFALAAFWLAGGLGGLILRLGTVGVGVAGEAAGGVGCDAGTFWLLGIVFGCVLTLLVRVCAVERVCVVDACHIIHVTYLLDSQENVVNTATRLQVG